MRALANFGENHMVHDVIPHEEIMNQLNCNALISIIHLL